VRQVEELAKRQQRASESSPKSREMDDYIQSLAENLKRHLGTKVEIRKKGKQGRIVIHFYSDEELDRLLELLS
jgi:ParB family chromosome partitioning protein